MIPKTIHQIFWDFSGEGKPLIRFNIFHHCHTIVAGRANRFGFDHILWGYEKCENLLKEHYPQYLQLWEDFSQPVMKCDFIRYIILYHYGGIYMDMDMYPAKDFTELLSNREIFTTWNDDPRNLPYNALMMSEKGNQLFLQIAEHSKKSYYQKYQLPGYVKMKGRLVFQTTGHKMLRRVLKKHNIIPMDILRVNSKGKVIEGDNPYFVDFNASVWYISSR